MSEAEQATAEGGSQAQVVAAVDLGSNSFHMLVARASDTGLQVIDRLREPVRLAAGLAPDKSLQPDAETRALECLTRMGQRLRDLHASQVRAVGTNTLRRLRRGQGFIPRAEHALGHRIEIIAGVEEARLIYGGVTHGLAQDGSRQLVVDIGGGSTELIIGQDGVPELMESVHMGCVSHTQAFFPGGKISRRRLNSARDAAGAAVKFLARSYRQRGWDLALGASGSVRAVWKVAAQLGYDSHAITAEAVEAVIEAVLAAGHIDKLDLPSLREDRRPVFVGSLTVLAGIFQVLNIQRMEVSDRALREGVIYDLLGRLADKDVRDRSTAALATRFGLDAEHAARVQVCAQGLLEQVAQPWQLNAEVHADFLRWAAQTHEVGLAVSHAGYHKHSAYILGAVDLHGFSRMDQQILAAIARNHRGKWSSGAFEDLREDWRIAGRRLAVLLRLAVIFNRGRNPAGAPVLDIQAGADNRIMLRLPDGWLTEHPLTRTDLDQEASRLRAGGFTLEFQ